MRSSSCATWDHGGWVHGVAGWDHGGWQAERMGLAGWAHGVAGWVHGVAGWAHGGAGWAHLEARHLHGCQLCGRPTLLALGVEAGDGGGRPLPLSALVLEAELFDEVALAWSG